MTLKKMLEILRNLELNTEINMHGSSIYANGGGELTLSFNTQPSRYIDNYLRRKGFIVLNCDYIYRPRERMRPPNWRIVSAIRQRWPGEPQWRLAIEYGITQSMVSKIVRGEQW